MVKLGVGPRAPDIKKLTAEELAEAIHIAVSDSAMRARAAASGKMVRAESGIAKSVCHALLGKLCAVVLLDADIHWRPRFNTPDRRAAAKS